MPAATVAIVLGSWLLLLILMLVVRGGPGEGEDE
jgi:hypothetical protein